MPAAYAQLRVITAGVVSVLIAACSSATSPVSIEMHRAQWKSHGLANYDYTYEFFAGFSSGPANEPLRVMVRQDTVRSAQLADGTPLTPGYLPTIDELFDRALAAAKDGSLKTVTFDPDLGYPTLIAYDRVPDALQSEQASALQAQP